MLLDIRTLTGEVVVNPETTFVEIGQERFVFPPATGGKTWPSGTYSPLTNVM